MMGTDESDNLESEFSVDLRQDTALLYADQFEYPQAKLGSWFYLLYFRDNIPILTSVVLLALSVVLLVAAFVPANLDMRCERRMTGWSPLLDSVQHTNAILDPDVQSLYKGQLNTEVDRAWNDLWHYGATGIKDDKLALLNKSTEVDWVRHNHSVPQYGGQIKAYSEGFHRIHCLHLVMQYAFRESYDLGDHHYFRESPHILLRHVEHCLDNVRWGLQCSSDVTPYLIKERNGVDGVKRMQLNVRKPAKCRDLDSMRMFAKDHTVGGLRGIHDH